MKFTDKTKRAKFGPVRFMNTKTLRAIVSDPHHCGPTGRDFGPLIEEIQSELWQREQREAETAQARAERMQATIEELQTGGKACRKCGTLYVPQEGETLEVYFSPRRDLKTQALKFRSHCRRCINQATKERQALPF